MSNKTNKYTPQQEAAVMHRGGSLLVSSGAGAGKTMVLVDRLLGYIEDKHNIDQFLVITYTRAAAHELRERIQSRLQEKMDSSPGNMHLRRQAMLCPGANIDTIHTFCSILIRENAHFAKLPPDFRVADGNECVLIKNEVLEQVFNRTYEDADKSDAMIELLNSISDGRDDSNLKEIILDIHTRLMSTSDPEGWVSEQIQNLQEMKNSDISETQWGSDYLKVLKNRTEHCLKKMQELQYEMGNYPEFKVKYESSIIATIGFIGTLVNAMDNGWDEAVKHANFEFVKPSPISGYDELKAIRTWCKNEMAKITSNLIYSSDEHNKDLTTAGKAIVGLLNMVIDFNNAYTEQKREMGILDYSDLEHITLSLLRDKQTGDKTAVAQSAAQRFKEIMVDEYQDVNEVQETIFRYLSKDESNLFMVGDVKQSIYRFRLADPTIFIKKYTKYSDATPSQQPAKSIATQRIEQDGDAKRQPKNKEIPIKINLTDNFRSRPQILEAINCIFKNIMSETFGEIEYSKAQELVPGRKKQKGKQGIQGKHESKNSEIDEEADKTEKSLKSAEYSQGAAADNGENLKSGKDKKNSSKSDEDKSVVIDILSIDSINDDDDELPSKIESEAKHVAKKIKELISRPYYIENENGKLKKIEYSDIAILSRSVKGITWRYSKALSDEGIPNDLSITESFFKTAEIQTAISLLSVIDNPKQDIPLASVLSGPVYNLKSDELAMIRSAGKNLSYYDALKTVAAGSAEKKISQEHENMSSAITGKCKEILSEMEDLRTMASDLPADKFIMNMYNRTGLLHKVDVMNGGDKRVDNLLTLAEHASIYEKSGYKGLFGFLMYLRELEERDIDLSDDSDSGLSTENANNTVKILSIHKSKGLEFPVVFLVNTTKKHNTKDISKPYVFHKKFGVGATITDREKRIKYTTLTRTAISEKLKREMLSEELRILYVAMTRAREKLIITATFDNFQKVQEKMKLLEDLDGKYSPEALMSMSSMAEWILAGIKTISKDEIEINLPQKDDNNPESIETAGEQASQSDNNQESNDKAGEQASQSDNNNQKPEDITPAGIQEDAGIEPPRASRSLDFVYPYEPATKLPSKLTVTGLKALADTDAQGAAWTKTDTEDTKPVKIPRFIKESSGLTGAKHGIFIHEIMKYIDYNKCSDESEMSKDLQRIAKAGLIDESNLPAIKKDIKNIIALFQSDLGKRMIKAKDIKREFKFSLLTKAKNYYPDGGDDKILIQGIVDCFFEEDGQLVIVDFKTDKVKGDRLEERIKEYTPQLEGYAEALKRITGKNIKEKIIYFLSSGRAVSV